MNAPKIAKAIRRTCLYVARAARWFESPEDEEKFVEKFLKAVAWVDAFEHYTDRQVGKLIHRVYTFPSGTKEEALISEISLRLQRSPAGPMNYDGNGKQLFNYVPLIRLVPAGIHKCDGCGACDRPVDEALHNCLYCLALKYSVEVRRDKLANTLRANHANIAKVVRDKLREFNSVKPKNSPEVPPAS
jgi:hypothetical protein